MHFSDQDLIERIPKHDLRAVSRLISLCENRAPRARKVQAELFKKSGSAHVVGITGAPGAGKSTLVDQLAFTLAGQGKRVAVIAVDPSSPFSGGAILGDRIRMIRSAETAGIFVRSMATRGALGGVALATMDAIQVLDAACFTHILVETVGVGQAEVDIVRLADTCLVVLVPGMGDSVQAFKAGILEIADIFAINKADREGADLVHKDLRLLLSVGEYPENAWVPPICKSIATTGEGVSEILTSVHDHRAWLLSSPEGKERRRKVIQDMILKLAREVAVERVLGSRGCEFMRLVQECYERRIDPYSAVERLLAKR